MWNLSTHRLLKEWKCTGGLSFLLVLACRRALGRNIVLRHSISEGYYWEDPEGHLSQDDIEAIRSMMADLVSRDLPFIRKVVSLDKAPAQSLSGGSGEVARLFKWAGVDPVELCRCADLYGYYYAPCAPSTGYRTLRPQTSWPGHGASVPYNQLSVCAAPLPGLQKPIRRIP